jgi:hypothetical protein
LTAGAWYAAEEFGGPWQSASAPGIDQYDLYTRDGVDVMAWASLVLIGGPYRRAFYRLGSAQTSVNFVVGDPVSWADNTGSLGWRLKNATYRGRQIDLYGATIQNVCPAG